MCKKKKKKKKTKKEEPIEYIRFYGEDMEESDLTEY